MELGTLTILAIDDNQDNLITLSAVLADALPGARILTAMDGPSGIGSARKHDPDVILLDILMPGMDGLEVCRRLKAEEILRDIPVVFLTALRTERSLRVEALEVGGDAFLTKPPDEQELLAQIRAMAKLKAASRLRRLHREDLVELVSKRTHELEVQLEEKRQAEAVITRLLNEVQQEKESLRALLNSITDEVWFADLEGRFTLANPSARSTFDLRPDQVVSVSELAGGIEVLDAQGRPRPLEDSPPLRALQGNVVRNQEEYVRVPSTGELRYRLINAAPVYDAANHIVGAVAVARDLTERRRMEEDLRSSEAKLRVTIDEAPVCVGVVGLDQHFLKCNRAFCSFLGYSEDELKQRTINDVTHPQDLHVGKSEMQAIMAGSKDSARVQKRYVRKDGSVVWGEITIHLIREPDGRPAYFLPVIQDITERKAAEFELGLSQERFSKAFLTSPYAIAITRPENGTFVEVNEAFSAMTGYSRDEALAESSIGLNLWYDNNDRHHVMAELRAGRAVVGQEFKFRRSDGQVIVGLFSAQLMQLGGAPCVLSSINDVSQRKHTEEALRRTEAILTAALDQSPIGIVVIDESDGKVRYINNTAARFYSEGAPSLAAGAPVADFLELTPLFDLSGRKLPNDQRPLMRALHRQETISGEYVYRVGGFRERVVQISAAPIKDHMAITIGAIGVFSDVTDVKRAEENYKSLFEQMLNGFAVHELICDANGVPVDYRFLAFNPAFERMTGLKQAEVVGRTVKEVLPGIEDVWIRNYGRVVLSGEPMSFEESTAVVGKRFEVTAFRTAPGCFACVVNDVTERRATEMEREKLRNQLVQAQKMEAIGRLAGGVAHDFNNLLIAIRGNAALAKEQIPEGLAKSFLTEIEEAGVRATEMTSQLLAYSRRQVLAPKVLDLNSVVGGMVRMLVRMLGEDIRIQLDLAPNVWPVCVDPTQMEQVVMNLAVNARDAMPGGGPLVFETRNTVVTEKDRADYPYTPPGEYVQLAVTDCGAGMDTSVLEHLFEPFFTTKPKGKGTGLGLSTVFGIVKQHSGFIEVRSKVGQGTRFEVLMPRAEGVPVVLDVAKPLGEPAKGTETLLLVEDDPVVARLLERLLAPFGYNLLRASSGQDALEVADHYSGTIHLLLSDVIMPGMIGTELAAKMVQRRPETKVLLVSGYSDEVVEQAAQSGSRIHFLGKPYTKESLGRKVRAVLDGADEPVPGMPGR